MAGYPRFAEPYIRAVTRRDFAGLERLASIVGVQFVQGIVLYDGEQSLSFADNLRAVPIACSWA
jgi:hypothetical protein